MKLLKLPWDQIIKYCLYAAMFLTPLLFFPWTVYQVAWNKQFVLVVLVFVAAIAWLIKSIVAGEIQYTKTHFNFGFGALIVTTAISVILSDSRALGLWGATGAEVSSLLSVVTLSLLFFLVASFFKSEHEGVIPWIGLIIVTSGAIVAIIGILQMWGVWFLPWDFTKTVTFNTIGTSNVLALFFGFLFVVVFTGLHALSHPESHQSGIKDLVDGKIKILGWIFLAVLFLALVGMRFWAVFMGIALMMLLIALFDVLRYGVAERRTFVLPLVVAALSVFFALANFFPILGGNFLPAFRLPAEVMPSISASWKIITSTAQQGWQETLFGSGPGTFQYQYGLYRSSDLNATDFWGVRFAHAINALLTHVVEWGVVGSAVFIIILAMTVWHVARQWRAQPILSIGLLYLILTLAVYPQNVIIYFALFMFLGLSVSPLFNTHARLGQIRLTGTPFRTFSFSLGLMLLIMVAVSVLYVEVQRYIASIYFNNALRVYTVTGDVEKVIPRLMTALDFDPRNDLYLQNISQAYLLRLGNLINRTQLPPAELQAQFSSDLGAAIQAAKRATEINPRDSQNWIALGRVYENVILLVPGAADLAVDAYVRAQQLEPHNPIIATALGRSNMLAGDYLGRTNDRPGRDKAYAAAILALEGAVQMKSDYTPAHFLLVQIYDRQGRVREAIARAEAIRSLSPNDVGLVFQLGLLHYRVGRYPNARVEFERAIELFPNYSNARYFLGLIYDRDGQRARALDEFEQIAKLNPDNAEVRAIIRNLRLGRPALESGIAPNVNAAPIEEGGGETKRPALKR